MRGFTSVRRAVVVGLALMLVASAAGAGIRYTVTNLGSGKAIALNDRTEVVGHYPYRSWANRTHSWHWDPGTGAREVLPPLPGLPRDYRDILAWDINDHGLAVGQNITYAGHTVSRNAFAYSVRSDAFENASGSVFYAVNDDGVAAGKSYNCTLPNGAIYYTATWYNVASGAGGTLHGADASAQAINNRGATAGGRYGNRYGWIHNGVSSQPLTPAVTDGRCLALDLNDYWPIGSRSLIVGRAQPVGGAWNDYEACTWNLGGVPNVIGCLADGDLSEAIAVNNSRQVVGWSRTTDRSGGEHAFLWEPGTGLRDLNDLLVGSSATVSHATDINDRGEIVGYGPSGALLLRPVYFGDGSFDAGDLLAHWTRSGDGTANLTDLGEGNMAVVLTAGSPVILSQEVATPVGAFDLFFDYEFLTADPACSLTVALDGTEVASLSAPPTLVGEFTTHSLRVDDEALSGLDPALLAFTYDGPSGTQCLLDNVEMVQLPEPATLALLAVGAMGLLLRNRR
jgi:probable HAF family extracellular repeat protein